MRDRGVTGLLVAVFVVLLLDLGARFSMSSPGEQAPAQARAVGISSVVRGDTLFLFRTFEDGRTEVTSTLFDVDSAHPNGPLILVPATKWSALRMK